MRVLRWVVAPVVVAASLVGASRPVEADPLQIGGSIVTNYGVALVVANGVETHVPPSTLGQIPARIGTFTATHGPGGTWSFNVIDYWNPPGPEAGYTRTTTVEVDASDGTPLLTITALPDGSVPVQTSTDGGVTWTTIDSGAVVVNAPTTALQIPVADLDLEFDPLVRAIRTDLDAGANGFTSSTAPVPLAVLLGQGTPNTIPLTNIGRTLDTFGIGDTPCTIDGPTKVSLDPASNSVSFFFDHPPTPDLKISVLAPDYQSLYTSRYISGPADLTPWTGSGATLTPTALPGVFQPTLDGNVLTVPTVNDTSQLFTTGYRTLQINTVGQANVTAPDGSTSAKECWVTSPAIAFDALAGFTAPAPAPSVAPPSVVSNNETTPSQAETLPSVAETAATPLVQVAAAPPTEASVAPITEANAESAPEPTVESIAPGKDLSDDNGWIVIVIALAVGVLVLGGVAVLYALHRRRQPPPTEREPAQPRAPLPRLVPREQGDNRVRPLSDDVDWSLTQDSARVVRFGQPTEEQSFDPHVKGWYEPPSDSQPPTPVFEPPSSGAPGDADDDTPRQELEPNQDRPDPPSSTEPPRDAVE
jgi:hypothetical protein